MTVRELLGHINIYPDKICFYDEQKNIQDTVYIKGEHLCPTERYYEFVEEYGDRDVIDWTYGYDNLLDLSF